jgi:hypothetical protein
MSAEAKTATDAAGRSLGGLNDSETAGGWWRAAVARWIPTESQWFGIWATLLIVVGGFVQTLSILNPDLAWLFTLDEKWLSGQRLYIDLFEVNPPMSALMYMPAVLISKSTHILPENIVGFQVVIAICLSTALSAAVLWSQFDSPRIARRFAMCLLFLLIIFPTDVFGQRDHIATIAIIPFVSLAVARRQGLAPPRVLAILAGLGAGIAMTIKPHYALVAGLPLVFNAVSARSIRPLFRVEFWAASLVVVAYALIVEIYFSAYLGQYLGNLVVAYLHVPRSAPAFTWIYLTLAVLQVLGLVCLRISGDERARKWTLPWLMASLGGLLLFISIGKWWSYTGFAMLTFAVLPVMASMTTAGDDRPRTLRLAARLASFSAVALCMLWLRVGPQFPYVKAPLESVAPPHPKMISIADNLSVGHPLVRNLHGEWVGTSAAQVLAAGALRREELGGLSPETRVQLDRVINADRQRLLADIQRGHPDIILVDDRLFETEHFDWWKWAMADPQLARELGAYHQVGVIWHRLVVWKRNATTAGGARMTFPPDDVPSKDP